MLKKTARILTGLTVVTCCLSACLVLAGPFWDSERGDSQGAASAQAGSSKNTADAKRRETDDLLRRARQAMAENNLQAAEQLLVRAESLGVQYNPLHFGDTPQKVRRDLLRKQEEASGNSSRTNHFLNNPFTKKKAPTTNPFAGKLTTASEPKAPQGESERPVQLPPVGQAKTLPAPPNRQASPATQQVPPALASLGAAVSQSASKEQRVQSDNLLIHARRALGHGDVRRAKELIQEAKALGVHYAFQEDSPEKIEGAVSKYQNLMEQNPKRKQTEAFRRQYARLMMEQAEAMLAWKQYDDAERLANQAADQRVTYSPFESTPRTLLQRIAAARRQNTPATSTEMATTDLAGTGPSPSLAAKQRVVRLTRQARAAMTSGDLTQAELLAREALRMGVPDSAFGRDEDRPGLVLLEIEQKRTSGGASGVVPAAAYAVTPATGKLPAGHQASQAYYDSGRDTTRNIAAGNVQPAGGVPNFFDPRFAQNPAAGSPTPAPPQPDAGAPNAAASSQQNPGMALFEQGMAALRAHDSPRALQLFRQASAYRDQLDPLSAQRLQDHLQLLSSGSGAPTPQQPPRSMTTAAAAGQDLLVRQVHAELAQQERNAAQLRETNPKAALELLEEAKKKVAAAGMDETAKGQLLRRVDRSLAELRQFIEDNQARIELDERNTMVRDEVKREQQVKLEVQEKLALMVDEFNRLMDEQRFAQAEIVAKRAKELDPENPVVLQLEQQAAFTRRFMNSVAIRDEKAEGFVNVLGGVEQASIPFDADAHPLVFPDPQRWEDLTRSRAKWLRESGRQRSPRELEIEQKLKTPVSLQFQNRPLSEVLDYLAKLAEVNMHLDPLGLEEEGVTTNTPVTINLSQEISLKSALNLILQPLHLSYVIKDEVLKITSEQLRDGEVHTQTYSVADLVVPIPNFVPSANMGLQGALHDAYGSVGFGGMSPFGGGPSPISVVASKDGRSSSGMINPNVLAQMGMGASGTAGGAGMSSMPMGFGPGGLGGGAQADFDSLIELITTTIQPTTWDEVGGPGSIAPFETNLSLVISQTQEVHEEIADLLKQLRRLQDLQVTIEVRFITLNDNFFERIGVDFDFDIDDDIDRPFQVFGRKVENGDGGGDDDDDDDDDDDNGGLVEPLRDTRDVDHDRSVVVGMSAPGVFSADLDIPFTQGSYGLAVPQFGGFDAAAGASMGFAILSDIEAFFFINAAQGDRRTNVLQAPKVTLFNGQQAFVSDTSQSPFVISVIPVVGDFAAAQQPVIVVLSEGTFLTVQAVVSNDRRFVRLTVVPFFSNIGEVNTFTFTGEQTSTTSTSAEGKVDPVAGDDTKSARTTTNSVQGTTVQLPTFSFITVTTTVSVPDGGTVLLGGIKRLNEGRSEFGVPMLNKLPYINRLFKNVGIGRETQSLMMMVTPRIIIQEEEEEAIGVLP